MTSSASAAHRQTTDLRELNFRVSSLESKVHALHLRVNRIEKELGLRLPLPKAEAIPRSES